MKRLRILIVAAVTAVSVAACDSLKEAFTAHVDVVARAGGQELSTERLASLMANGQIPIQKDIATVVANFWVSYQLLGHAGARGDSLSDPKVVDAAMWAMLDNAKASKFYDSARRTMPGPDTTGLEQKYAQGTLFAAQHILIMMPENGAGMSQAKQDSIKNKAEGIRKRVTPANFGAMAKQYTEEPGGKEREGSLGVWAAGGMVPEFDAAVRALKPGDVSASLVRTLYGFHIIRRHELSEVREQFVAQLMGTSENDAQAKYMEKLIVDYKLEVKPGIAAKARDVAKDPGGFRDDKTVLASSKNGDFTAGRLAKWLQAFPRQSPIKQQIINSPDSVPGIFVKMLAGRELVVAEANKAKVKPDTIEVNQIRGVFKQMVMNSMNGLGVDPESLGDTAKSTGEKERVAAQRVEAALDQLFATNGQNFVEVPDQLAGALRDKYSSRINDAGLDRAVERALALRAALDSTRAKQAPQMMPEGSGAPIPPGATRVPVPPGATPMAPPSGRGRGGL